VRFVRNLYRFAITQTKRTRYWFEAKKLMYTRINQRVDIMMQRLLTEVGLVPIKLNACKLLAIEIVQLSQRNSAYNLLSKINKAATIKLPSSKR
jgi:hypothetical protein